MTDTYAFIPSTMIWLDTIIRSLRHTTVENIPQINGKDSNQIGIPNVIDEHLQIRVLPNKLLGRSIANKSWERIDHVGWRYKTKSEAMIYETV